MVSNRLKAGAALLASLCASVGAAHSAETDIRSVDQRFSAAVATHQAASVSQALDAGFRWIDIDGQVRTKDQTLASLAALNAHPDAAQVQVHAYGPLATVFGKEGDVVFTRVLKQTPEGWVEYLYQETKLGHGGVRGVEHNSDNGPCENPCKAVPYQPATQLGKDVLAAWQSAKVDEWHPNATHWATTIADEFRMVNTSIRDKATRIAIARKQEADGRGAPGDPVLTMNIEDFGPGAALMTSTHYPYGGGKPIFNTRVWVKRDNRWQLALSQITTQQGEREVDAPKSGGQN